MLNPAAGGMKHLTAEILRPGFIGTHNDKRVYAETN